MGNVNHNFIFPLILILHLSAAFDHYASIKELQKEDETFLKFMERFESQQEEKANVGENLISDADGYGRTFDGIGGLSGGGATSRLLVNYPQKYRDEILDYLFKPNFGASLQILKVEIGGDAQSTDGTEPSHMHTEHEKPDFNRGYEWWLMKEAKKRNPDIKLVGLPWGWPGWVGNGTVWPYSAKTKAASYIVTWILGAASVHNLTIDYVGIWNEKPYDIEYIKVLRKQLDQNGFKNVIIIAADQSFASKISTDILNDPELRASVGVIGTHYPGTISRPSAVETGMKLWASEDYSTYNDDVGAGCWARILNQNYVNGNMTATISWNLIASYYGNLPFNSTALMTANQPWSGHYIVPNTVWITAHTTQFTKIGWTYLKTVGHLSKGGSYVALTDRRGNLTIVVEKMSRNRSTCIRPFLPQYSVASQNVTFALSGTYKSITKLYFWHSYLGKGSTNEQVFVKDVVSVVDGEVHFLMNPDTVVTLSTVSTALKGSYSPPPPSKPFPFPYRDTFDLASGFSEANNFADQSGVFEIYHNQSSTDGHSWTMRQVAPQLPLTWCDDSDYPISIIGDHSWSHVNVTVDVKLEDSPGVFIAARIDVGGCKVRKAHGAFLWLDQDYSWHFTTDLLRSNVIARCESDWKCWQSKSVLYNHKGWNTLSLAIDDTHVRGYLNAVELFKHNVTDLPKSGWAGFGVKGYDYAQFDNFVVQ